MKTFGFSQLSFGEFLRQKGWSSYFSELLTLKQDTVELQEQNEATSFRQSFYPSIEMQHWSFLSFHNGEKFRPSRFSNGK